MSCLLGNKKILLTFCTAIFFEIIDNKLQFDEAIRACRLHESVNKQRLHYQVLRELERRQTFVKEEAKEGCCSLNGCATCGPRREGMTIEVITQARPTAHLGVCCTNEDDEDDVTNTSPLTTSSADTFAPLPSSKGTTTMASTNNDIGPEEGHGQKTKRTRKSARQASEARIDEKEAKQCLNQRYSSAFKDATFMMSSMSSECTIGGPGTASSESLLTTEKIISQLNELYNLNGTKKKLARSTIYRALARGDIGKSPLKKGPPIKIPDALLEVVAVHTEVCQVGEGELRGRDIKRLIGAAVLGTEYHDKFKVQSVWKKVRREFPEKLQATSKLSVDDARGQWTTYSNLQQWFDDAKRDLIDTGLVIDREVRDNHGNLISELDFRSDEVRRRFINMDETHHDLSITGDRGGPRSVVYHNCNLQRGSRRGVKSSRHVTGVYATNAAGESLPPMYIFDSCAKIDDNFRVRMQWLDGLPTISGRFGCPTRIESSSFYSVRAKGSMDDSLLNDYIDKVVLPLYPNISKQASFDAKTGNKACSLYSFICIFG